MHITIPYVEKSLFRDSSSCCLIDVAQDQTDRQSDRHQLSATELEALT